MNKSKHPVRIVVTRTSAIEALLQEVWRLKPEIRDRVSLTVSMAFIALIRESTRERAIFAAELSNYQSAPVAAHEMEHTSQVQTNSVETASTGEPHPDTAWN